MSIICTGEATSSLAIICTDVATSSLSDQVSEASNKKLLQLELENKRLLRQLQTLKSRSDVDSVDGVGRLNGRNGDSSTVKSMNVRNGITTDLADGAQLQTAFTEYGEVNDMGGGSLENGSLASVSVGNRPLQLHKNATTPVVCKGNDDDVDKLLAENRNLRTVVTGLQATQDRYADIERRSADVESENVRLRRRLENVEQAAERCEALEQTVARLTVDVEYQRRAAGRAAELSATVAESELELDNLRRVVADLRASVESSRADAERAELQLVELGAERDRLKRHVEAAAGRTGDLRRKCDELTAENGRLRRSADATAETARRLEKRIGELERDAEMMGVEKAALADRVGELEEECRSTGETADLRCRTAEVRCEELERRVEEMSRERLVDKNAIGRLRQVFMPRIEVKSCAGICYGCCTF